MIVPAATLIATKNFTSKKTQQNAFKAVAIYGNDKDYAVVATDGYRIGVYKSDKKYKPEDYPKMVLDASFLNGLKVSDLRVELGEPRGDKTVEAIVTDRNSRERAETWDVFELSYPNWKKFIDAKPKSSSAQVGINPEYLASACKAVSIIFKKEPIPMKMRSFGAAESIHLEAEHEYGPGIFQAVIMPVRLKTEKRSAKKAS